MDVRAHNLIDAATEGGLTGLRLALNIGALLVAFVALIALANLALGGVGGLFGYPELTLQSILGALLSPLAFVMGVPWAEAREVGAMIGLKTILNEFVAYEALAEAMADGSGLAAQRRDRGVRPLRLRELRLPRDPARRNPGRRAGKTRRSGRAWTTIDHRGHPRDVHDGLPRGHDRVAPFPRFAETRCPPPLLRGRDQARRKDESSMKRAIGRYGAIAAIVILLPWSLLGLLLEGFVNRVEPVPLPSLEPRVQALHSTSLVADLHADSLLFGRDLLERSDTGHVDLPRLQEGGVGLQVFAVPTVVPFGMNIHRTELGRLDLLTLAGIAQLSPTAWLGPTGRALRRAEQLRDFARASNDALLLLETRADVERLLAARAAGAEVTGALLAIEGAHALESKPENLERLFEAGYRMIGLTHFFDNDYGGSAHGVEKGGLTPLGRETIARWSAWASSSTSPTSRPTAVDEALDLATRPVVFSHGGVRATCDNPRNLSDAHVRRIAEGGGVIGIGYWH